jgi:energy-coupling factor transport system permease protein
MLVAGALVALAGLYSAGRRVQRTRYRPDRWRWPETAVALCGVLVALSGSTVARSDILVAHPGVETWPTLTTQALVGIMVGVLPAVLAPPPVLSMPPAPRVPAEVAA